MPAMRTRDMSRSLDVTPTSPSTDSPQTLTAPALQLISPTPRTLIFPTTHNLSLGFDPSSQSSPYSSPSASPFEGAAGYEQGGFDYKGPHTLEFQAGAGGFDYGFQQQQQEVVHHAPFDSQPQQQYAVFNASQTSFHAYDASKNSSSLSLTIPELPAFTSNGGGGGYGGQNSPSDGETGSVRSVSPSGSVHSTHKRRKSTSSTRDKSTERERRPKKGDADYVKRPENAFILFRRAACEERQAQEARQAALGGAPAKKQRQADLSKAISEKWRNLSAEEKREWDEKAQEAKKQHAAAHPDYVYRPERKSKSTRSNTTASRKNSLSRARRGSEDSASEDGSGGPHLSVFVPMHPSTSSSSASPHTSRHHHHHHTSSSVSISHTHTHTGSHGGADRHRAGGRSLSAPRPYHRIDVPRVSHGVYGGERQGSEPTSPSLVPLINEHSRGGGWDYVNVRGGRGAEYPSMSMVSSLFTQPNANAGAQGQGVQSVRKSSAPSPLQQVASSMGGAVPSPLAMIQQQRASLPHTVSFPGPSSSSSSFQHHEFNGNGGMGHGQGEHGQGHGGSDSSSSESGSPYTPSSSAPTHLHAFGMMPSFEETLLDPPTTFDSSLLDPSLPSSLPSSAHPSSQSHMHSHLNGPMDNTMGMDSMSMEGMLGSLDGEAHMDAYGAEGAFGGWDWPVGEGGVLDNEWDVSSIPLASLSPSSLSPTSLHSSSALSSAMSPSSLNSAASVGGGMASPSASQLAAQFGGLGVGSPGGKQFGGEGMEFGDPTLIGVGGYDDILAGGAFA